MRITSFIATAAMVGSLAAIAAPANATITLDTAYHAGLDQVEFGGAEAGNVVSGVVPFNTVEFASTDVLETANMGGNVTIWGLQSGSGTFSNIEYSLANPDVYFMTTNFTIQFNGTRLNPAVGTLVVTHLDGTESTIFQNRNLLNVNAFNLTASAGDGIKKVSLKFFTDSSNTTPRGAVQLDSIELGAAVPEPATWALMIMGFGGAGAMLRTRRRQAFAA